MYATHHQSLLEDMKKGWGRAARHGNSVWIRMWRKDEVEQQDMRRVRVKGCKADKFKERGYNDQRRMTYGNLQIKRRR